MSKFVIIDEFLKLAQTHRTKPALVFDNELIRYGELPCAFGRLRRLIHAAGIRPGALVACCCTDRFAQILMVLACIDAGMTVTPVGAELIGAAIDAGAEFVITDESFNDARAKFVRINKRWRYGLEFDESYEPGPGLPADKPAVATFTSGSTGLPKLFVYNIDAFSNLILNTARTDRNTSEPILVLLGLATAAGVQTVLSRMLLGRTLHVLPRQADVIGYSRQHGIQYIIMAPMTMQKMLEILDNEPPRPPLYRDAVIAGSLLSENLARRGIEKIARRLGVGYGATEVGPICRGTSLDLLKTSGCVGAIGAHAKVEIVDEDDHSVPSGQPGRIRIHSNSMAQPFQGLDHDYGLPGAHWFYSGDVGYITEDGKLVLTGRMDDLVNLGGVKHAPEVLEDLLCAGTAILDAAVLTGSASSTVQEDLHIFAVLAEGAGESEATAWVTSRIPGVPARNVHFIAAIPQTDMGKKARRLLRERLDAAASARP